METSDPDSACWMQAMEPAKVADPVIQAGPDGSNPFSWTKQWYGVAAAHDLDPSRPNAVTLLGKRLVIWKDGAGTWSCLEDRCPHRAAPLSGRRHAQFLWLLLADTEIRFWQPGSELCQWEQFVIS